MKSFQSYALANLIRLFVRKAQGIEYEKAGMVFNSLVYTLKFSGNDRRKIICDEVLANLKVNGKGELCWK